MMNLAEYRRRSQCLADFLPWAALVGRVSSSTRTARSSARPGSAGPTSNSATPAELVATTARLNNALRRLGSGWAIFIEAQRVAGQPLSGEPLSRRRLAVSSMPSAGRSSKRRGRISRAGTS